jgi:hypothetical protein
MKQRTQIRLELVTTLFRLGNGGEGGGGERGGGGCSRRWMRCMATTALRGVHDCEENDLSSATSASTWPTGSRI